MGEGFQGLGPGAFLKVFCEAARRQVGRGSSFTHSQPDMAVAG